MYDDPTVLVLAVPLGTQIKLLLVYFVDRKRDEKKIKRKT